MNARMDQGFKRTLRLLEEWSSRCMHTLIKKTRTLDYDENEMEKQFLCIL